MSEDFLDYGKLIDDAMHQVVSNALKIVQKIGLNDEHHFFITFNTQHPDVMIADELMARYPKEMTIVVQHQFWNLEIEATRFSIVLSFDGVKQNLTVPFDALIAFADPSVKFGLQFSHDMFDDEDEMTRSLPNLDGDKVNGAQAANVVTLDSFRKK